VLLLISRIDCNISFLEIRLQGYDDTALTLPWGKAEEEDFGAGEALAEGLYLVCLVGIGCRFCFLAIWNN
jgi:hypothetical protein